MAMGLHPTEIGADWRDSLDRIEAEFRSGGYIAVGEVGIDLYWDKTYYKEQLNAFSHQLGLAKETGLPVIIHSRDSLDEIFKALKHAVLSVLASCSVSEVS